MKSVKNLRYKRTLFVGLGGAGAKTLRLLKEQIKNVNEERIPEQVKFLLIDTNATDLANYRDFDSNEKVCIAVREPYQRYLHDKGTATHEFIPTQNSHSLLALERGAGQIRSNGHFAVIENQYSNKLAQIFRHTAEDLENIDIKGETLEKDPKIEVKLVFSIAGGTGSGTFLPISVLLRSAIKHCEITAYIYSATHYERIVERSAKYAVMQNAYASLCELDYMMHFGLNNRNQLPIKFNFGPEENQHITQKNRPFEEVYYIDKITSLPTSDTIEFAYNEIDRMQKNTADALFIAATNIISSHTGTVDNVRQKVMEGQFDVNDKFAWVSGLGMAELYLSSQGTTSPKVIDAGNMSLLARTGECEITNEMRNSIVSAFMDNRWDESKEKNDGDPILTKFLDVVTIEDTCRNILVAIKNDSKQYHEYDVYLDDILQKNAKPNPSSIIETLKNKFYEDLDLLVKKLLNDDGYTNEKGSGVEFITGAQGAEYGISLVTLKSILKGIISKLDESKTQIKNEYDIHHDKEIKAKEDSENYQEQHQQFIQQQNQQLNQQKWYQRRKKQQPLQTQQIPQDYSTRLAEKKSKALAFKILKERDKYTIEVLDKCIEYTNDKCAEIELWLTLFKAAYEYGSKQQKVNNTDSYKNREENRVEVQLMDVDIFKLSYEDIVELVNNRNKNSTDAGQSIFEQICIHISNNTGSLQKYLKEGLDCKKSKNENIKNQFNKESRTPFQKSIDHLIDLSTPTMQIDGHGFGDRVKADQFWYVMTDCGDDVYAESREHREVLKTNSVGGLLKKAIEQNALDERVNLVHVSGWSNKAILYRVLAAVPPYFVEGVCSSDCGGITLESCYEELKKTKHTYTPFSHEELRKKLENGRTVLKPHETTSDDIALEYWVNFMILGKIDVKHEKNSLNKERKNLRGIYTVVSELLGEYFTGDVVRPTKILTLGEGARNESFNTFARYCKTIVSENKEYEELIDPLQNDEYEKTFILSPEEYLEKILVNRYGFNKDIIDKLPEDNPDKELIRKEMDLLKQRKINYEKELAIQNQKKKISDDHKASK